MAKYNFQTAGSWDRDDNSGHVHQAPAWIHHILIERIQALWMSSDEITDEEISKNHMAWRLYFSINQPTDVEVEIGDYKSGILSMEVEYDLDEDYTFPRIPVRPCAMFLQLWSSLTFVLTSGLCPLW